MLYSQFFFTDSKKLSPSLRFIAARRSLALGTYICSFISRLSLDSSFSAFALECLVLPYLSLGSVVVCFCKLLSMQEPKFAGLQIRLQLNLSDRLLKLGLWFLVHFDMYQPFNLPSLLVLADKVLSRQQKSVSHQIRSMWCPSSKHFPPTFWREKNLNK